MLRTEEVSDEINVIVDDRWAALFPMETLPQVNLLVEAVNKAVDQKYRLKE